MSKKAKKSNSGALRWIYDSVKPRLPIIIIIMILTCVLSCTGSVVALILGGLVNAATGKNLKMLIILAVLLGVTYLVNIAGSAIVKYLSQNCKAKLDISIRRRFFSHILRKDYSKISEHHSGELMNIITSDVTVITDAVCSVLPNFAGFLTKFVFALIMILSIQPWIALIYCVVGITVIFAARIFRNRTKLYHKKSQQAEDKNRSFWQESLYNLLAVKVFAAENSMIDKSDRLQDNSFKARMKSAKLSALTNAGYSLFMCMGYVFAFVWCTAFVFLDLMNFGTMTTVVQLVGQIQSPFSAISGIVTQYYTAIASAERLIAIEKIQDEPPVDYVNSNEIYKKMRSLRFDSVSFAYDRDNVLSCLDLSLNKGEFIGIIGNSGIGKSTLFKLMLGVYQAQSGEIYIDCNDEKINCSPSTRTMFAYVPQGNMLFSGTILDNITMINQNASDEQIEKAIKISCCDEFISELPNGIHTEIGEKGYGLSEGQIQRIAIARAILANAPILLLDEATSALDGLTEEKLLQNLREIHDVTCIIVTHRKKALSICDKTLRIESGKAIILENE